MINVTPIILCGGSGTRLWPLSRAGFPRQFLVLSDTSIKLSRRRQRNGHSGCNCWRQSSGLKEGNVIVKIAPSLLPPHRGREVVGCPLQSQTKVRWVPEINVHQMCQEMLTSDLKDARRHALLKANGYQVNVSVE